ncbi:MAG: histidine--tRNA ligase [Bacteroidota bacterium]
MATQKFSVPKGTRDFLPKESARRNFIFSTLKDVFELFGYQPIETPSMENLSTLLGKYGDEGDKLVFRILNSGDFLNQASDEQKQTSHSLLPLITEKGLRYDLTVPFARFVVQHRDKLVFPFKRYQIQPVWRADRPQKGRYREFFQCDVDVIGSNSLLNEVELLRIIAEVFKRLNIQVKIHLNNRKILAGIAEVLNLSDRLTDITVAIDKLDKMGIAKVNEELLTKGIPAEAIERLQPLFTVNATHEETIRSISGIIASSETGMKGVEEMKSVLEYLSELTSPEQIVFDLSLARGLNYYTGTIFEVRAADVQIGSICGGGRYDNLTGIFGLPDVSGVGISFGADRIYDVMNELNVFPEQQEASSKVLLVNFGGKEERFALKLLETFRNKAIASELYPDNAKIGKQFAYADNKQIQFVIIAGSNEIENGSLSVKNMKTGEQYTAAVDECIDKIVSALAL